MPGEIRRYLKIAEADYESRYFVTMFSARFDTVRHTLQYANGGHNPPLFVSQNTHDSWLLEEAGPIKGILPDAQFANCSVALGPGDVLALFTDGVTEQREQEWE